jgi:hypothetical protein
MSDRCLVCHAAVADQLGDQSTLHGALQVSVDSLDCRTCHPEHRGASGLLTVVDQDSFPHQVVGFSLSGHQETANGEPFACRDCHGDDLTTFDLAVCQTCHDGLDPAFMADHVGAFGSACLGCHDGIDTYGAAFDHDRAAFPLRGQHAEVACIDCHAGARSPVDLQQTPTDCFSCHAGDDPHDGRLGKACDVCHTPDGWGEASIDHSLTAFPLTGAHLEVDCEECHQGDVFVGTPTDCYSCHAGDDAHAGRLGQACDRCHTTDSWGEASIDHSLTAFPLTGAHAQVSCNDCHADQVFAGTPQACVACHPDPAFHRGALGTDCALCHTTAGWAPARFDRAHPFPIRHGSSAANSCDTCHPDRVSTYTCYNCHEHNPAEIRNEHLEEGISDFQDCVRCHPTGQEEEREGGDDD